MSGVNDDDFLLQGYLDALPFFGSLFLHVRQTDIDDDTVRFILNGTQLENLGYGMFRQKHFDQDSVIGAKRYGNLIDPRFFQVDLTPERFGIRGPLQFEQELSVFSFYRIRWIFIGIKNDARMVRRCPMPNIDDGCLRRARNRTGEEQQPDQADE